MGLIMHGNYINGFSEKIRVWGQTGYLGSRMVDPVSQIWIHCKDYIAILHSERDQERHKRNLIQGNLVIFGPKMVLRPHNFGSALRIFY